MKSIVDATFESPNALAFVIGWQVGNTCDREFSFKESTALFPHWNDSQHDAFCQGSIDGHAKDMFRLEKARMMLAV